jgi:hypothetical protein
VTRSLPKRGFALLWALLFLLGTAGEGFGFNPCPFHDGSPGEDRHEHGHSHGHHGESSNDHHGESDRCTHLDVCQTTTVSAIAETEFPGATWVFPTRARLDFAPHQVARTGHPPFFLPYANAPPARG